MKLIIQPGDGTAPVIKAIKKAKRSVEIIIFRFDQAEIESALIEAVERGVFVHALIAFTNKGGEQTLRRLEMRFLDKGITVARTADDLARYHGKMMLIDRKELFVFAYNFTHLDTERSRSFGIGTKNRELVQEAARLFESDTKRQPYKAHCARFIVSPANARQQLAAFLRGAKRELLIYDIKITDRAMQHILEERFKAGLEIRVIGQITRNKNLLVRCPQNLRLHARVIIRDRTSIFLGSQSLRKLELDSRREIGVIVGGAKVVNSLLEIFKKDWKASSPVKSPDKKIGSDPEEKRAKKVAKVVEEQLPVAPVVKQMVREMRRRANLPLDSKKVKKAVEAEVKSALKKAVKKAATRIIHKSVEDEL